jgi:capsular exopolysaccharide synthesis family protein
VAEAAVKERLGLVDPGAPSSEPFRSLRLALQLRADGGSSNAVLFTSPEAGDGKSTVAANYALISSVSHSNVLLIDGDLRKPTLHELFGIPRSPGLVELLAAGSSVKNFVQRAPTLGQLDVLPAGRPIARSGDLASSKRMGEMLRQATNEYELVVIDAPPVLGAADAAGIASHGDVDVVLVVKRAGKRRAVRNALRKLELLEANVAGIVVNREGRLATYGYGYGY